MSNKNKHLQGIVYSTDPHFSYERDDVNDTPSLPNAQQQLRVRIEKNHRGGKTVTVVSGFTGSREDLESLAKTLRQKCGTGGSAKEGLILVQGDMKERIVKLLLEMGYKAK